MALDREVPGMSFAANASESAARESAHPRNALLGPSRNHSQSQGSSVRLSPAAQAQLLRSAIGHAAVLSDTPEKWAATIALLKHHGVDPMGYDDFDKGRARAIEASGVAPFGDDNCEENLNGR
jgi:hypothetical protein